MEQTSYSKLSQRDVDRAETDLLINLSTLTQRSLAKMIGCHESKISRTDWRFIASVLCAFGMASDISPITRASYPDTRQSDRSGEDAFLRKRNSAQVQPRQQRRASRNS